MRWWVSVVVLFGLGWAQPSETEVLGRCQRIFNDIRPLLAYTEEIPGNGVLLRVILGRPGQWLMRLTFDGVGDLVPIGLEEVAPTLAPVRRGQMELVLRGRLLRLFQDISLASWSISEDNGFRCVVVNKGRFVGVLRLNRNLRPAVDPEWSEMARQARLRWPLLGIPVAEPQRPNP